MRFTDEKHMWYAETEALAERLANKSVREIQEILDKSDVITLRSGKRPKTSPLNRLAFVVFYLPIVLIAFIKWVSTGDAYLDSWAKKNSMLNRLFKLMGIKDNNE